MMKKLQTKRLHFYKDWFHAINPIQNCSKGEEMHFNVDLQIGKILNCPIEDPSMKEVTFTFISALNCSNVDLCCIQCAVKLYFQEPQFDIQIISADVDLTTFSNLKTYCTISLK